MGVPAFFRQIIEKYKNTHSHKVDSVVNYFFIDFNSIIYDVYHGIDKKTLTTTNTEFEKFLIAEVVKRLSQMINVVEPTTLVYIAMDGPAPRAKMIQQRWRRYKSVMEKNDLDDLKKVHGVKDNGFIWDKTAISPGTKFMKKLSTAINAKIRSGFINKNSKIYEKSKNLKVIFSDSNVPGEGEHKFLPIIRNLSKNDKEDTIVIYSPDADMIVLSMATHKDKIYIMRSVKGGSDGTEVEKGYIEAGHQYLFLSIDTYRKAFLETLKLDKEKIDPVRVITDYIFLTFMGGNDFVMPIPYLKVKKDNKPNGKGGLGILLNMYVKLFDKQKEYLIYDDKKTGKKMLNINFFKEILIEISKSEDYHMRGIQMNINRIRQGQGDEMRKQREEGLSPYDIDEKRYMHLEYFSKLHPQYDRYKVVFEKFDFSRPKHEWKAVYYNHFFNLNPANIQEYNIFRTKISANYLESLIFTMRYYFEGVPSWSWFYEFRAPPPLSDLVTNLTKYLPDMNNIKFELGKPYLPFEQLMMILPVQLGNLLPKKYCMLMKNELLDYYPIGFDLDVLLGEKNIYSEPILPTIDADRIVNETRKLEESLNKEEKERNTLRNAT